MSKSESLLARFDAAKESVRSEIREFLFNSDGSLKISDDELWSWIAARAVDEMKLVAQLSQLIGLGAHLMPPRLIAELLEQVGDETRHYEQLRQIIPLAHVPELDEAVMRIPRDLAADKHWQLMVGSARKGDPFTALIDINIVHEGFSAAAIEELQSIPNPTISAVYVQIGADEDRHHQAGRRMLEELLRLSGSVVGSPDASGTQDVPHVRWSQLQGESILSVTEGAHKRQRGRSTSQWSWPP